MTADPNSIEDEALREMIMRMREVAMEVDLSFVDSLQAMAEGEIRVSQDGALKPVQ